MKILEIAKHAHQNGENVMRVINEATGAIQGNSIDSIEISYELQSGSYVEWEKANRDSHNVYCREIAHVVAEFIEDNFTFLDLGTGEMTTLSKIIEEIPINPSMVYACDISWSRLRVGQEFMKVRLGSDYVNDINLFCAEMSQIPLPSKSMDVVITCHAIEPNSLKVDEILREIFRVARKTVILFEPSYEENTEFGKQRMTELGYISGLKERIENQGFSISKNFPIWSMNPNNPTHCYIIEIEHKNPDRIQSVPFTAPGTDWQLEERAGYYLAGQLGLAYPTIEDIPILRDNLAIYVTKAT